MTQTNPYVGPKPLSREDPIFGREQELRELRYLLTSERIVVLHSPSGAGKSSLINGRGGLCDQLRARFDVWLPTRVSQTPEIGVTNRYVWSAVMGFEHELPDRLRRSPELLAASTLKDYVTNRPRRPGAPANVLLIFDQFEEILRVDPVHVEEKRGFFAQLGGLLVDPTVWALFVLREDYLAPLDPYVRSVPTHMQQRYRIDLLRREQARETLVKLAEQGGRLFADDAVDRLLTDLAAVNVQNDAGEIVKQTGEFVEPLQMQVVCRNLWDRMPAGAEAIGQEHVEQFGNVTAALADYYASSMHGIAAGDSGLEWIIRQWVGEKLITPDRVRNQVLRGTKQSEGLDNALVQKLVDTHLVRGEKRGGAMWYELAHDRLIDPIRGNNRQWSEARLSAVEKRAILWESEQSEGLLLVDEELDEAKAWAAANRPVVDLREFLAACEKKQAHLRRERRSALVLRGALIVAVGGLCFAGWEYREAKNHAVSANAGRLATAALLNKDSRVDLAALLSLEARRVADSFETRNSVLTTLQSNPALISIIHLHKFVAAAYSWDGKTLALVGADDTLQLWDVSSRQPLGDVLKGCSGSVSDVAFSRDGKLLAFGCKDSTVQLWDVAGHHQRGSPLKGHLANVTSVAFSPDGERLASGSDDNTVRLWDVARHEKRGAPLMGHSDIVTSVAFSPDGKLLASGSEDNTVWLWNVDSAEKPGVPLKGHTSYVNTVVFSPDGERLASGSDDNTVRLWDVASHKNLGAPLKGHSGIVTSVAFSPDGKLLASGSEDATMQLWEVASRQRRGNALEGHSGGVLRMAFSKDSATLASASSDETVRLWDVSHRQQLGHALDGHSDHVTSVAFSPDGKLLASASSDHTVRLWDVASRQPKGDPLTEHHEKAVAAVAFSPNGKILASASDKTVRLWDVSGRKPLGDPLSDHPEPVLGIAFSPNGKVLASASGVQISLWDVALQRKSDTWIGHKNTVHGVALSPDGKILASASFDKTVGLWDLAKPKQPDDLLGGHSDFVNSVAFSPDGKILASVSRDHTVRLWDVAKRTDLDDPLKGHFSAVNGVAFSPDGKLLATASDDKTVRLWDVDRRQPLGGPMKGHSDEVLIVGPVKGHSDEILSVSFSPDGKLLASASNDRMVMLWDIDPDSWASRLCPLAGRNLSMAEWRQFIGLNVPYRRTCPAFPPGEGAPSK